MKTLTTEEAQARHEKRINAMKRVLESPDGKIMLEFLRMAVNPDTASFTAALARGGTLDTHMVAYLDGRKSVYFEVLSAVELAAADVAPVPAVEPAAAVTVTAGEVSGGGMFQKILRWFMAWVTKHTENKENAS